MYRLVVSDLDGTLLPAGETRLSGSTRELILQMQKLNITFAVASGRAYHELKRLFEGMEKDIIFVPSDGSAVVFREKTYFNKPLKGFTVKNMVQPIDSADSLQVMLSGKYISYLLCGKNYDKAFAAKLKKDLNGHLMEIKSLDEITGEVYKLSFYGEPKSTFSKKILSGTFTDMAKVVYRENGWTDFIAPDAGKENALHCMMKNLKVSPDELAVVGDGRNDAAMLKLTKNSRAVEGADEEAVLAAGGIIKNADELFKEIVRKAGI